MSPNLSSASWTRVFLAVATLALSVAGCKETPPPKPKTGLTYRPAPKGAEPSATTVTTWHKGEHAYVAPDGANLRAGPSIQSDVVTELMLGTEVVVEAVGAKVERVLDRVDVWYEVSLVGSPQRGFLFGNTLTPMRLIADLDLDGEDEIATVAFNAGGTPRVRVLEPAIGDPKKRVRSVELRALRGQPRGGEITARVVKGVVEVEWCRGAAGAAHKTCPVHRALYRQREGVAAGKQGVLEQVQCFDCSAVPAAWQPRPRRALLTIKIQDIERAPTVVGPCETFGVVRTGKHRGNDLVVCRLTEGGKEAVDEYRFSRYVRGGPKDWTWLPLASSDAKSHPATELKAQGVKLTTDAHTSLAGLGGSPRLLEDERGALVFRHHLTQKWDRSAMKIAFHHLVHGPVYRARPGTDPASLIGRGESLASWNGFFIPDPHGGTLLYGYEPLVWTDEAKKAPPPYAANSVSCAGEGNVLYEPSVATAKRKQVRVPGMRPEVEAWVIDDDQHPLNLQAYDLVAFGTPQERKAKTAKTPPFAQVMTSVPQVFIQDSFDDWLRLRRADLRGYMGCEPILYLYPDRPTDVTVRLSPLIDITAARPYPVDGSFQVQASPTGTLTDPFGRTHRRLFWEGRGRPLPLPSTLVRVSRAEVRPHLFAEASARGLVGVELQDFVQAWAPKLEQSAPVDVGFHDREAIDAAFPVAIEPAPTSFIRVLMDFRAAKLDKTSPSEAPGQPAVRPVSPPSREGFVAVEWGGLVRD